MKKNELILPTIKPILGNDGLYELAADWIVFLPIQKKSLFIKKGFRTDGASIPRAAWFITSHPFDPEYIIAAIAHDALYKTRLLQRHECDIEFLELLKITNVSWMMRSTMYEAVRIGGLTAYKATSEPVAARMRRLQVKFLD